MRIAVVHSRYRSVNPSGENLVVDAQVEALIAAGHEVHLLTRLSDEVVSSVDRVRIAARIAFGSDEELASSLEELQPDVIHVHNLFPNFGRTWLQKWGSRTVLTHHNFRLVCAAASLVRNGRPCFDCVHLGSWMAVVHRCYRDSALLTLPLAFAARRPLGREELAFVAHHIFLNAQAQQNYKKMGLSLPSSVLPNFIKSVAAEAAPHADYWVYAGRLSHSKGHCRLVNQWPSELKLVVAGAGACTECVQPLAKNIQYVGAISNEDVVELLRHATGLLVPSQSSEGFPTVILEALGVGVPSICTSQVAVASELENRGVCQVIQSEFSTSDLREACQHLVGMDSRQRCLDLANVQYSADSWLAKVEQIYLKVAQCTP